LTYHDNGYILSIVKLIQQIPFKKDKIMTNAQIIFNNRVFLMEQGVIKGVTGQTIKWADEQGEREILMPEEIHTFQTWKALGYQVQKGEHAVAKFPV
jgi:hypothetical protein